MKLGPRQIEVLTALRDYPADSTAADVATHIPGTSQQGQGR